MKITVQEMVETAMLVALAIILDLPFLKFRIGQNGGSVSFTMVPLFILAIRRGPIKGFIGCGIIYGIITCGIDGWGIQTFPFDYLLGYGSIAIAGFFKKQILESKNEWKGLLFLIIAIVLGCFGRFVFATISSMVLYEYAFVPALVYNISYIGVSAGFVIALMLILYKPFLLVNSRFPTKSIC
ncbi:MAG: energy-coupled thiamine transporter ThiT [Firmicutes bacterium]|nr:energy-coupled thiamine transporter ThiT [Candidatus Fiminaster equi]